MYVLPSECIKRSDKVVPSDLADATSTYDNESPNPSMLSTEYSAWVRKRKCEASQNTQERLPDKLVDYLFPHCSLIAYPNLNVLLRISLTLPITSCQSERSFNQLKLIKTTRRSTMGESRLSALSIMKINRERCNEPSSPAKMQQLVKDFAQAHPRKIKLYPLAANTDKDYM